MSETEILFIFILTAGVIFGILISFCCSNLECLNEDNDSRF